jgi:hypothetical protein
MKLPTALTVPTPLNELTPLLVFCGIADTDATPVIEEAGLHTAFGTPLMVETPLSEAAPLTTEL